jgi:hypothetical protein
MELENYLLEQKLKDKNYQPNAEEIKEFIRDKLADGNLGLEQGSSDAMEIDTLKAIQAVAACAANQLCVRVLVVASIAYAGYLLYKNIDTDSSDKNHELESANEDNNKPNDPNDPNNNDVKNKLIIETIKHALDQHQHSKDNLDEHSQWKIEQIIDETSNSKIESFTSNYKVTENEALELGLKWLGEDYKQVGPSDRGVFRSADGTKQFRIDNNSLLGNHAPNKPHIHIETVSPDGRSFVSKNHIIIGK